MKKSLKIVLLVLVIIIGLIVLDTMQAKIFNNSPILKIRENFDGGNIDYLDKGIFVNYYKCNNNDKVTVWKNTKYSCPSINQEEKQKQLFQCLENELGAHILTENDNLVDLPLNDIIGEEDSRIAYYKGAYASNNPDNLFVILYPKNGTYEANLMKKFDKYFYEKFTVYQEYASPLTPTIYIHNKDHNIDFKEIVDRCMVNNNNEGKNLPNKTLNKLKKTNKIVVGSLGTIENKESIDLIIKAFSSSKRISGDIFLCDYYAFEIKLYDDKNKLIDTIYTWYDGKRIMPKSINSKGCSYYSITNDIDIKKIIEEETNYKFYNLIDYRDNDTEKEQLIYEDQSNSYYIKANDINEVLIYFDLTHEVMPLHYALKNEYITIKQVLNTYAYIIMQK